MPEILNEWTYRQARARLRKAASPRQAAVLATLVGNYEALKRAGAISLEIGSLEDLGAALVKGRIGRGWTQEQLARALDMPKQQVQRYEATAYASASLGRLIQITGILNLRFVGRAEPGERSGRSTALARQLAGMAAAEAVQAAERRIRLRRLTAAEARRIYDDLCETYYRLAPLHETRVADGAEGIGDQLALRRAMGKLARPRTRGR